MPIQVNCSHCDSPLRLRDEVAGKKIKCPRCGNILVASPLSSGGKPEKKDAELEEAPAKKRLKRADYEEADDDRPRKKKHSRDIDYVPTPKLPLFWGIMSVLMPCPGVGLTIGVIAVIRGLVALGNLPTGRRGKYARRNMKITVGLGCTGIAVSLILTMVMLNAGREKGQQARRPEPAPAVQPPAPPPGKSVSLAEARQGFKTRITRPGSSSQPVPQPPPNLFRIVHFDAPAGKLAAYLSPNSKGGAKCPAIIWITGGDCNSIDEGCWTEGPPSNDQSASAFRKAGIIMMFPSLRGGSGNPGTKEGFFGEVDDVLAAAQFLATQPNVDPNRIYLGGHSTGGTLVLLVAECSDRFRAVFSFGPAHEVAGYGPEFLPFDTSNPRELELRSPGRWLSSIKSPVFVFEGTTEGNLNSLQAMARGSTNPKVRFLPVPGANHFSVLTPTTRFLAEKILRDTGATCNLTITDEEVNRLLMR